MGGRERWREEAVNVASTLHIFCPIVPLHTLSSAPSPRGISELDTFFFSLSYDSMRGGVAILRSTQSRTVGLLVVTRCQIKHLQIMTRFFQALMLF